MSRAGVKNKRRIFGSLLLVFGLMICFFYGYYWMKINVPSKIKLLVGEEEVVPENMTWRGEPFLENKGTRGGAKSGP